MTSDGSERVGGRYGAGALEPALPAAAAPAPGPWPDGNAEGAAVLMLDVGVGGAAAVPDAGGDRAVALESVTEPGAEAGPGPGVCAGDDAAGNVGPDARRAGAGTRGRDAGPEARRWRGPGAWGC